MSCRLLSNFETIKSFYERLTKEDSERPFYAFKIQIQYCLATFDDISSQNDIMKNEVIPNWNYLNLNSTQPFSDNSNCMSVGQVCKILEPFVKEHGLKPILLDKKLIKKLKTTPLNPDVQTNLFFHQTDMNPYAEFNKEFSTVSSILKDQPELILGWLRKKTPAGIQVYVIGNKFFIGRNVLIRVYPRLDNIYDFKSLFTQDTSSLSEIYISKLTSDKFKLMFGNVTVEDALNAW